MVGNTFKLHFILLCKCIIINFLGSIQFTDLDERAFDAIKELDEDGALAVVKQFNDSNLVVCNFYMF